MASIAFEKVSKAYCLPGGQSVRAVSDLSLNIADGELLVLVGPSGCGKTTTLRLLAGLEKPSSGSIKIDGKVINGVEPKDRDLAMVFQNPALYPHLSVYDNLALGLKLRKFPKSEIEGRVTSAAQTLRLVDCLDRLPGELSGGQKQRVAIGRALVRRPGLFLFDEPLSDLDAQSRSQLRTELLDLQRALGCTMLYVTHDQIEALTMGHRVAVMKSGVVQQVARPMELYHRPANQFVAGFIGTPSMNFLQGRLMLEENRMVFQLNGSTDRGSARMELPESVTPLLVGQARQSTILGVRPEDVLVSAGEDTNGHHLTGIVIASEVTGPDIFVRVACSEAGVSLVSRTAVAVDLRPRQNIWVKFLMEKAHLFEPASGKSLV